MSIAPDTKDWTWVLDRQCLQCGFDAAATPRGAIARAIRGNATEWLPLLGRADAIRRPRPDKWSCLEYACHVRDVLRIFDLRLSLMLTADDPTFENWDQNETALLDRYDQQEPSIVGSEVVDVADQLAARYESVTGMQWSRAGTRSNGSRFTVETLGIYGLHDPIHHLWDVTTTD